MFKCINCGGDKFDYGGIVTAGIFMQSAWDPVVYFESDKKRSLDQKRHWMLRYV